MRFRLLGDGARATNAPRTKRSVALRQVRRTAAEQDLNQPQAGMETIKKKEAHEPH